MPTITPHIATVLPQSGKRFHWLLAALLPGCLLQKVLMKRFGLNTGN